jgi:hypothetical protein
MAAYYDNCKMLNKDNQFMSFVDQNKMDWYIKKNLAEKIDEKTFKINFIPNGSGVNVSYYEKAIENRCVCCASTEKLTKHHVLPYRFKKYFPIEYKSHTSFDVLLLCETCHSKYEIQANKFQNEIIKTYNANTIIYNKEYKTITGMINSLLKNNDFIPNIRKEYMLKEIKHYFKDDSITIETVSKYLKPVSSEKEIENSIQNTILSIGGYFKFIVMWRKHFVDTMNPQYLSEEWKNSINDTKTINSLS